MAVLLKWWKKLDLHPQTQPSELVFGFRGVVEWFIAPVLKTGDPLRGPGVRIPPPLLSINQRESKPRIRNGFEVFLF